MRLPKSRSQIIAEEFIGYVAHHCRLAVEHRAHSDEREAGLHDTAALACEAAAARPLDKIAVNAALRSGATADHATPLARKARR